MFDAYVKIVIQYKESAPINDPTTGELTEGEQQVIVGKAIGDEKEYQFQLPITQDLPGERQLEQWQKDGTLVVVSSSSVTSTSFEHVAKDEEGNVKKYPKPGKIYKVGNKQIEVGTLVSFQSYSIRQADADDEQRAQQAYGRYLQRQQQIRMRSIEGRKEKARKRTAKRLADAKKSA